MRGKWIGIIFSILLMLILAGVVIAQTDTTCELDAVEVVTVIESVCSNTGNNELCYGNNDVSVATRENAPNVDFQSPGDLMSVNYIQSLYLSALNQSQDVWGVAQMRLVTTTVRGPQEVTLLLYGDVEVQNAVEPTTEVTIATTASINIRSIPRLTGAVIASAPRGTELIAVGRLEDTSWIRIHIPETSAVGWISSDFADVAADQEFELEDLDLMSANDAFLGPMQAFYINTGTNLSCDNVATDGLIIQTPEGTARVTILINEVSIDMISPPGGGTATAVVRANPIDGLQLNVTSGTAIVTANGSTYNLSAGLTTTIGMSEDLRPVGVFSEPIFFTDEDLLDIPVLEIPVNSTIIIDSAGNDVSNGSTTASQTGNTAATDNPEDEPSNTSTANGQANGMGTSTSNATGNANGQGNANGNSENNSNSQGVGN